MRLRQTDFMARKEALDEQIVFKQPTAAAPLQFAQVALVQKWAVVHVCVQVQMARIAIISLIFPMAFVGFRLFGQTSTQFMMVWHRNRR